MSSSLPMRGFVCPRCSARVAVPAGQTAATCGQCHAQLVVPEIASTADRMDEPIPLPPPEESRSLDELLPRTSQPAAAASAARSLEPLPVDDDGPLRIEGLTDPTPVGDDFRVTCPVCDSVLFATVAQIGAQVRCSDCHSEFEVRAPKLPKPGPAPLASRELPPPPDALSAFPEGVPDGTPCEEPLGEEYGLAPASEDLLRPRPTELSPELEGLLRRATVARETAASSEGQGSSPRAMPDRASRPADAEAGGGTAGGPATSTTASHAAPSAEAPRLASEPVALFRWPGDFLSPFADRLLLAYALITVLLATAGYTLVDTGFHMREQQAEAAGPSALASFFLWMMAAVVHLAAMISAGVLANQTIEGAAYHRSDFHPPEIGVLDWLSSFLVVGVSFWAGMLPGVLLGEVFLLAGGGFSSLIYCGLVTAAVLAPIGILSAYYNGSAFRIFSSDVVQTLRTHRDGWIRFYSWMAVWLIAFLLSFLLQWIPTLIGSLLASVAQVALGVLIARTIGLLAHAFIGRWMQSD